MENGFVGFCVFDRIRNDLLNVPEVRAVGERVFERLVAELQLSGEVEAMQAELLSIYGE